MCHAERMPDLRDAVPEDAAEVAGVHVRTWQFAYRGLVPDTYLDGLSVEDRASRYTFGDTRPDRPQTFLAVADNTIRGFATIGPARDDVGDAGEVYAIYVDPSAWGQGVGQALILEARRRLQQHGFDDACLWVLANNERAQRFYRTDGWETDGHQRDETMSGVTVSHVRYRRKLAAPN